MIFFNKSKILLSLSVLWLFHTMAMEQKNHFQNMDIALVRLIVRYVIAGQAHSENLLENSEYLFSSLDIKSDQKDYHRIHFKNYIKSLWSSISTTNKLFYESTKNVIAEYESFPSQVSVLTAYIHKKYDILIEQCDIARSFGFKKYLYTNALASTATTLLRYLDGISPAPHYENDLIFYFDKNKSFIDLNNEKNLDFICYIPFSISSLYGEDFEHQIAKIENSTNKKAENAIRSRLLTLFSQCYDGDTNTHYTDRCIHMQCLLKKWQIEKKFPYLHKAIKNLYDRYGVQDIVAVLEKNNILLCPILQKYVNQNYTPYPLLMKDKEILPNITIKQSTTDAELTIEKLNSLGSINEYQKKQISFEEFLKANSETMISFFNS